MGKKRNKWGKTVGVGAEGLPDWLGSRVNEIGSAWGKGEYGYALAQGAFLPFEALNRGVGYLTGGPIMGSAVAAGQAYRKAGLPGVAVDVPLMDKRLIPAVQNVGDIFDPQKAQERYEAINPLARMGLETAVLMAGPAELGAVGKLAGWEQKAAGARQLQEASRAAQPLGQLGRSTPSTPTRLGSLLTAKPVEAAAQAISTVAAPAAGLAAGIGTISHGLNEGEDPFQATAEGVMAGAITFAVGRGVVGLAGKARARVAPDQPLRLDTAGLAPDLRAGMAHIEKNLNYLEGYTNPRSPGLVYPGAGSQPRGVLGPVLGRFTDQHGVDQFLEKFFDRLAPLRSWQKEVGTEKRSFVLRQRAEDKDPTAWAAMADDEKSVAMWSEWEGMNPQEKIDATKLEPFQNFIQKATQIVGLATRDERYLNRIGVDLNAAGLDIRNQKVSSVFDKYLTLRAVEQRLGQGLDTDVWVADDLNSLAQVRDLLTHTRSQIDSLFPAPQGSAVTRSAMWDDAIERITAHYNRQLDRAADAGLLTPEARDRMVASRNVYIRGADATHQAGYYQKDTGGWLDQSKGGQALTATTTGFGVSVPTGKPFATSLRLNMEHFAWREGLIQKAELTRSLASWREFGGVWEKIMTPALSDTPGPGKGLISVFEKLPMADPRTGETIEGIVPRMYELPKDLADIVQGVTTESVDFASRTVGKFSSIFRAGITTLSLPFIFRNVAKDAATVLLQNGVGAMTMKSYIAAVYDGMTGGRLRDVAARAAKMKLPFDPIGRLEEAILSPSEWTTSGKRMTWREEAQTHGLGMATLSEVVGKGKTVAQMAGLEGGLLISNPVDMIRSASEVLEYSARGAVFTTARKADIAARAAGKVISEEESISNAVALAREATVDFSRSGNITRIANLWVPLLNARTQGTYRTLNAMQDDPEGFLLRGMLTIGLPTMWTYIHNREQFGDLYDKMGQDAKDSYYPIIFGSYNDRNGDVRPLYFAIPKDAAHKLIAAPIEHLMDVLYHTSHGGQELSPEDRTERTAARTLWDNLVGQSPISLNSTELSDPTTSLGAITKGVFGANPLIGTLTQLASNQDWGRGSQPIEDPHDLYAEDRGSVDPTDSALATLISDAIGSVGIWRPAPSQVTFLAKGFGGTAAQEFMGASDVLLETLGIAPPKPTDWSKLQIPAGTPSEQYERIADQLSRIDTRPWYVRAFPMFYGSSGGAQTQAAKVQQLGAKERLAYQDTRDLWSDVGKWTTNEWTPAVDGIQTKLQGEMTHGQANAEIFDAGKRRAGAIEGAKGTYLAAIIDPRERKAFLDRMPGIPVRFADQAAQLKSIEGTVLAEAIKRYDNPTRLSGRADLAANPTVRNSAQNAEVNDMAREYGVDPKDLEDQILASKRGATLPTLSIPAVYLEEALNRYMYPKGVDNPKDLESPELMRARNEEIKTMAAQWGILETELYTRIRARLSFPEERNPMLVSWEKALNLSTQSRDESRFPRYVATDGTAMDGGEADWLARDAELENAKAKYGTDYNKWPVYYRKLDDAKRQGELARLQFLGNDPDYYEYMKWFGMGRNLTEEEFSSFMIGDYQRYTKKGSTVEDWNQWDYQAKLYEAAPRNSPLRRALTASVTKNNHWMNAGWRAAMYGERAETERTAAAAGI